MSISSKLTKIIDKFTYKHLLTLIIILATLIGTLDSSITILDYIKTDNSNNSTITDSLLKMDAYTDNKIIFKTEELEEGEVWNYDTTLNIDFDVWTENPSVLSIQFMNFSKNNNTVKKQYMVVAQYTDYMDYNVSPENPILNLNIESKDRNKSSSQIIYLNDFYISGEYINPMYYPELNLFLGNITFVIDFKDLKTEKEINIIKSIPVYWKNYVYNR